MKQVSRELKLALVVGFCVVMVVAVLVSDHLSRANKAELAAVSEPVPTVIAAKNPEQPLPGLDAYIRPVPGAVQTVPNEPAPTMEPPKGLTASNDRNVPDAGGDIDTVSPFKPKTEPKPEPKTFASSPISDGGAESTAREIVPVGPKPEPKPEIKKEIKPAPAPVAGEKSHTIGEGDTLFKICKKYYGDGMLWKQLATYNSGKLGKDGTLKTGAVLSIPPREVLTGKPAPAKQEAKPEPKATKPATELAKKDDKTTKKAKTTTYTVKPGDTIGSIARKVLGTSKRAQEIINLNAGDSFSEDDLTPGMVIKVPSA